jgi:hypothetical protein
VTITGLLPVGLRGRGGPSTLPWAAWSVLPFVLAILRYGAEIDRWASRGARDAVLGIACSCSSAWPGSSSSAWVPWACRTGANAQGCIRALPPTHPPSPRFRRGPSSRPTALTPATVRRCSDSLTGWGRTCPSLARVSSVARRRADRGRHRLGRAPRSAGSGTGTFLRGCGAERRRPRARPERGIPDQPGSRSSRRQPQGPGPAWTQSCARSSRAASSCR